ncbi:MAG: hypothetical protein IJV71_05860 [Lachnospiraceae bacterium]|nr:hypothetical protein [Lachnospiraceae bacterium]
MSTELTKIEYLRSKITSLADHIRAKAGKSDAMTFAELEAAVDGITTGSSSGGGGSTGDSGSSTSTIENGYTINFYNYDKVLIESHSALCGNYIDAPLSYVTDHWENANGYVNQFPLTVSEDSETKVFDLYAVAESNVDKLYALCNVDKETYPYVAVGVLKSTWGVLVIFSETFTQGDTSCTMPNCLRSNTKSGLISDDTDLSDINSVVNQIIENSPNGITVNSAGNWTLTTEFTYYLNFEGFTSDTVVYYRI